MLTCPSRTISAVAGHLDVHRLAAHQLHRFFPQRAGDGEFVDVDAGNELRSKKDRRIAADDHRHVELLGAAELGLLVILVTVMTRTETQKRLLRLAYIMR